MAQNDFQPMVMMEANTNGYALYQLEQNGVWAIIVCSYEVETHFR